MGKKKIFTPVKIIVVLTLLIAVIVGGVIYKVNASNQKTKNALKAEETYNAQLKITVLSIQSSSSLIEPMAQGISSVWHDVIYNKRVFIDGAEATDFDTAIKYKVELYKAKGLMDTVVKGKENIKNEMEGLSNPPSKYKEAYDLTMKIYNSYSDFESMVESPSGSLTSYNQNYSDLEDSLVTQIREFNTRYPNN